MKKKRIFDFWLYLLLLFNSCSTVIHYFVSGTEYTLITYSITLMSIIFLLMQCLRIPKGVYILIGLLIIAIGYSCLYKENIVYIVELFSQTKFRSVWLCALLVSVNNEPLKIISRLYKLSYIILAVNIMGVFLGAYAMERTTSINYMAFGYNCVIWWAILTQNAIVSPDRLPLRLINIAASLGSALFITFYGSRGSVLAMMAFATFCLAKYFSFKRKFVIVGFFVFITTVVGIMWERILLSIIYLTSQFGISSRNLRLFQSASLANDTHRFETVYSYCIELIKSNFVFGRGIGADRVAGGGSEYYAHNLCLELWVDFGVLIGTVIVIYILYIGFQMLIKNKEMEWVYLFAPFFVTSMVRLMVSSSLYLACEFWMFICIYLLYRKNRLKKLREGNIR